MIRKKIAILFFVFLLIINFASATLINDFNNALGSVTPFLGTLFGDFSSANATTGELLFIKLLVFIILFSLITTTLWRIPGIGEHNAVSVIIGFAVSLIAVRYLTSAQLVEFIWLPYGVLGIVLSTLLPFIIGFFFIEGFDSMIIRKVGWSAFVVIFFGLGIMRWELLRMGSEWYQNLAWIYLIIAILSVLLIVFDKNIRAIMLTSSLSKVEESGKRREAAEISYEIKDLQKKIAQTDDVGLRSSLIRDLKEKKRKLRDMLRA